MDDRKQQYKQTSHSADLASLREKRRGNQNEIRKGKREQVLTGKRMRLGENEPDDYCITAQQVVEATSKLLSKPENKCELLKLLRQSFAQGTALIEAFLGVNNSLACLVGLLTGHDPEAQLAAAWCFTNIAAGTDDQAMLVLKHAGAYLVTYLSSSNGPLQDQCAWAIGNLAGEGHAHRETLRAQGALLPLVSLLQSPLPNVVQSAAFALSNMARDKESQQFLINANILQTITQYLVYNTERMDLTIESSWVLTYLSASGDYTNQILEADVLNKLVLLLSDVCSKDETNFRLATPVLRCLGNILCNVSIDVIEQMCQNGNLFYAFGRMLQSEFVHLQKEGLWALSNMAVFPLPCQQYFDSGLVPLIISLLSATFDIRREAVYCLCNIAAQGDEFSHQLLRLGVMQGAVQLIKSPDSDLVHLALTLVDLILNSAPDEGVQKFEECGGLDGLELHEYSKNETLSQQTNHILETYFYKDDD